MPVTRRAEYTQLVNALDEVAAARACIGQNRGPDKEQAREGYECAVAESLVPAMLAAIELAAGDMDARDVERIAEDLVKRLTKAGLCT